MPAGWRCRASNPHADIEGRPSAIMRPLALALPGYSYLSAVIGSTFVARRAGTKHAPSATPTSNNERVMKVSGSVGLTSSNRQVAQIEKGEPTISPEPMRSLAGFFFGERPLRPDSESQTERDKHNHAACPKRCTPIMLRAVSGITTEQPIAEYRPDYPCKAR